MNTAIQSNLQIIRQMEERRMLEHFGSMLNKGVLSGPDDITDDLWKYFSLLITGSSDIKNSETALANYQRLYTLALFLTRKHKRISSNVQSLSANLTKLKPVQTDASESPLENNLDPAYSAIDAAIAGINIELGEISKRMKQFIPEQADLKPLMPFLFLSKNVEISEGMVSIIIINENGADHLKDLLTSFAGYNTYNNYRIIITDRNSTDGSHEIIKSFKEKLQIEVLSFDQKYTTSYLNDLAADHCSSEFLFFLNCKAVFVSDIIPEFLEIMRREKSCGVVGASFSALDKAPQTDGKDFYGSFKFIMGEVAGIPDIPFPVMDPNFLAESGIEMSIREFRNKEAVFIPSKARLKCLVPIPLALAKGKGIVTVPAVSRSAMFCRRRDFIDAGGFNLNYHNGKADIDLCLDFTIKLNKKTLLGRDIGICLATPDISAEFGSPDEISRQYNLGTLLNRHGYYIKDKYFNDLINKSGTWTSDRVDAAGLAEIKASKLRIAIKIPAFNNENLQFWGDYHFANSLKNAFIRKGHPCRVDTFETWHENGYLTDDAVIVLRGMKQYHTRGSQINIIWNISHPEHIGEEEYSAYDHVFVASEYYAGEMKKAGIMAESLLQCTDPELFYPDPSPVRPEEDTDILFVGNSRGVLRKSVKYCMEKDIPVSIYGTGWENLLPPEKISGNFIRNDELRKYYSHCNILLNDHWSDMADAGFISNRIFDALACGAIILTDHVIEMEKTFGEGLFVFHDAEEMQQLISQIRENSKAAKQLSLKLSKEVLKHHTFDKRAEKILETVKKIHEEKTGKGSENKFFGNKLARSIFKATGSIFKRM